MNFDFSDDQKLLKEQVRKFLADKCPTKVVRRVLDGNETHAEEVWKGLVDLGVPGVGIPEEFGGLGLSPLELCVVAEEIGRAAAPVPFDTSVVLATEALKLAGSDAQKKKWLPQLARGEAIGTLAVAEGPQPPRPRSIRTTFGGGRLNGKKVPVADGEAATFAIVLANTGGAGRSRPLAGAGRSQAVAGHAQAGRDHRSGAQACRAHLQRRRGRASGRRRRGLAAAGAPLRRGRGLFRLRPGGRRGGRDVDGARLCAAAPGLRPRHRLLPGDQAQARRLLRQARAGALQRLLRRHDADRRRRRPAAGGGRGAHRGDRGLRLRRQGEHPDPRRHRLHLGGRHAVPLPPRARDGAVDRRADGLEGQAGERGSNRRTRPKCAQER